MQGCYDKRVMSSKKPGTDKSPKCHHPREDVTPKQRKFMEALVAGAPTKADAALQAGYSPNNPDQSAYQAMRAIKKKTPEYLDEAGLTVPVLIQKHLVPLLHARRVEFIQHNGKLKIFQVKDNTTRRYGTRLAFELHGAFPPEDPALAGKIDVDVVILDIPRPDLSKYMNVKPTRVSSGPSGGNENPPEPKQVGDGHKPDPRPKD